MTRSSRGKALRSRPRGTVSGGSRRLGIWLAALLMPAIACQRVLTITPASESEAIPSPSFVISDPAASDAGPHYNLVQLFDSEGRLLWHIRAEPFGDQPRSERIVYGETPDGFEEVVPAEPLAPGASYSLMASGQGRYGLFDFRVSPGGRITSRR
jgi:hypothetical protein